MQKPALTLSLILLLCLQVTAQSFQINGRINDSTEKKFLKWASVSVLQGRDSSLVSFTRSDAEGRFHFNRLDSGRYILMVTYPHFADYIDEIAVNGNMDLGTMNLTPASKILDAVIIRSTGSIRIKGDTTEFVADSFRVKEGATVEDLLKKLPGLSVNSKGEIQAQGKRVDKVLVDGEEFFGDDPTMATKNISAKAVDKVQVFDTKSSQQEITGMTTGNEGKTVNIKLKESAKKGWFAKAEAGSDFNKYYDSKAYYNNFKGKKKLSFYGTRSNVNTGSLNWQDRQKLGIEDDVQFDEISGYYYSFGNSDEFSNWSLRGLPQSWSGGALYSDKWGENDRYNTNLSYRYNRLLSEGTGSTYTQNILPTGVTYSNKFTYKWSLSQQHALNGKYEWKLDSMSTLKLAVAQTYRKNSSYGNSNSYFLSGSLDTVNHSYNFNDNSSDRNQGDYVLNYKKTFRKKGRQLLATLRYGLTDDNGNSINYTRIRYFDAAGNYSRSDTVDQQKLLDGHSSTLGFKTTYTEPLNSKWTLILDYSWNRNHSRSERNTFNKSNLGKYEVLDPVFNNNFLFDANSNSGLVLFRYLQKKVRMGIGSGISDVVLKLNNLDNGQRNRYHFLNVTPQFQLSYNLKAQTNIGINYNGGTIQPGLQQLQPLRDNTDVLNVYIGNPNLKVGFRHSVYMYLNSFKVLSSTWKTISFSYDIQQNAITQNNSIDPATGKRTYYPINVNGNRGWFLWSRINKNSGNKKPGYGGGLSGNGRRYVTYVNGAMAITRSFSLSAEGEIGISNEDKYEFSLNPRLTYNYSRSTIQNSVDNNYFSYGGDVEASFTLPWKLEFTNECDFDLRQRLKAFPVNTNLIIWNSSLGKKIFKKKNATISLVARDILNQNKGFNRTTSSTFISDDRYQRVARYFLLKFEWNFTKSPGGESK